MVKVSSWGRVGAWEHRVRYLTDVQQIPGALQGQEPALAFGMGRSYGDVCLNPQGLLWNTSTLDRFIALDQERGILHCESGVLLRDIQRLVVPRGWMLPVTPGTQWVTVGGAIANDVHGKNHHRFGTFGDHLVRFNLARTDGSLLACDTVHQADLFAATVGGIGLTGVVTDAVLQLRRVPSAWIVEESVPFNDLDEFLEIADESVDNWEYTVSWVDCFSGGDVRGIFIRGDHSHASGGKLPSGKGITVPFSPPISLVNRLSLRAFNSAYFNYKSYRAGRFLTHYEPFFYPLDGLFEWNRIYGPRGFYQYQCVVPRSDGEAVIGELFAEIRRHGEGSFLSVLKTFGERRPVGLLSFPMPGITLALDFPNRSPSTRRLFDRLDQVVAAAGGRLYLAKDARMDRALFQSGYEQLENFQQYRDSGISSAMSRRLMDF